MTIRSATLSATALVALPMLAQAQSMSFEAVPFAADDTAKRQVSASPSVTIDGQTTPIGFHLLARSGDQIDGTTFGLLTAANGTALTTADGSPVVSDDPDFTSLLRHGDTLYSITHFESRPGAIYLSKVLQDASGNLSLSQSQPIDFAGVHGLWVPCAGSVTPWGTHMGGEEYPPDAQEIETAKALSEIDDYSLPMARYFGLDPSRLSLDAFRAVFNPFRPRSRFQTTAPMSASTNLSLTRRANWMQAGSMLQNGCKPVTPTPVPLSSNGSIRAMPTVT